MRVPKTSSTRRLLAAIVAVASAWSCSSSDGGAGGTSGAAGGPMTGQLVYRVSFDMSAYAPSDESIALAKEHGVRVDGSTWTFPERPAVGEIEVNGVRVMTDDKGIFTGKLPSSGNAKLYLQLTDKVPFVTFDYAGLQPADAAPPVVPIALAGEFNPNADCGGPFATQSPPSPGRAPLCDKPRRLDTCPATGSCCKDYNGPLGNDVAYSRTGVLCNAAAVQNWVGSTCYAWTWAAPGAGYPLGKADASCLNEGANHWVRGHAQNDGPGCRKNHKGRFCDELDLDGLSVSPSGPLTVSPGGTLTLTVTNKTPGNETLTRIWDDGAGATLSGDGLEGTPEDRARILRHWETDGSIPSAPDDPYVHYVERTLTFTAPSDLHGQQSQKLQVGFASHGKFVIVDVTVEAGGCFYCKCTGAYFPDYGACNAGCKQGLGCFGTCTKAPQENCHAP